MSIDLFFDIAYIVLDAGRKIIIAYGKRYAEKTSQPIEIPIENEKEPQ